MNWKALSVILGVSFAGWGGLPAAAQAADAVYVNGYTRADGVYVPGHYRSAANATPCDNWSTAGNQNPFTGEDGGRRYSECSSCSGRSAGGAPGGGQSSGYSRETYSREENEARKKLLALGMERRAAAETERQAKKAEREATSASLAADRRAPSATTAPKAAAPPAPEPNGSSSGDGETRGSD